MHHVTRNNYRSLAYLDADKLCSFLTDYNVGPREQETKNIFISPDMTPREQELNKKLRLDVKELNKDGNRYQIKNGKIVQRRGQF